MNMNYCTSLVTKTLSFLNFDLLGLSLGCSDQQYCRVLFTSDRSGDDNEGFPVCGRVLVSTQREAFHNSYL